MFVSSFRQKATAVFLSMLLLLLIVLSLLPETIFAQPSPPDYDVTRQCFAVADERVTISGKDSQDTLVRLDRTNGQTFAIGLTHTLNVEAIAFGPNNILYAADAGQLGTVDVNTGVFTPLSLPFGFANGSEGPHLLGDVDGIFYDMHTERFYGAAHRSHKPALLFVFDPNTGAFVPEAFGPGIDYVVISGPTDVDDIAIDPVTDVMYATSETGALYTINMATGAATQVAPFHYPDPYPDSPILAGEIVDDMEGLSFFNDGQLYGSTGNNGPDQNDKNRFFRIDKVTGTAILMGPFPAGLQDIESIGCLTADSYLSLKKSTNGPGQTPQDADTLTGPLIPVGSTVTWSYAITNTGILTLTNLTLIDDKVGLIGPGGVHNCPPANTVLGPGDGILCTVNGVAQAGQYTNTAIVTGSTPIDLIIPQRIVTATNPSHYFGLTPGIDIQKFTNNNQADNANDADVPLIAPGAPVIWTYRVTNTGNAPFTQNQIKVTDSVQGPITQIVNKGNGDAILAPGETWIYQQTGIAANLLNDLNGITKVPGCDPTHTGQTRQAYENIGIVTAGSAADADPSHYCNPPAPAIDIEKFTAGNQADDANDLDVPEIAPGALVTWTYHVMNTGNIAFGVSEIKVTDNVLGPITNLVEKGNGDAILAPGELWVYEQIGTAANLVSNPPGIPIVPGCDPTHTGLTRSAYENIGMVTVRTVSDTDKSHYCNPPMPGLAIEKFTNGKPADGANDADVPVITPSAAVTWTYRITNTGNVPFAAGTVKVKDNLLGPITKWVGKGNGDAILSPGETWIYQEVGIALNLSKAQIGITIVPGCDFNHTGQTRPTYENIGTVTAQNVTASDSSHYCNPLAAVGDRVFIDVNPKGINPAAISAGNGVQDAGESGVDGVKVQLRLANSTLVAEKTTTNGGLYRFDNVLPGSYYLVFINPSNVGVWTTANQGNDDAIDSDVDASLVAGVPGNAARTAVFTLNPGQVDLRWDAGLAELTGAATGSLGDYVWHDRNGNGLQDEGAEQGLANVQVKLFTSSGQLVAVTTTNQNGFYLFLDVAAGQYYIEFALPQGFDGFSPVHQGSDPGKDSDVATGAGQLGRTAVFTFAGNGATDLSLDAGLYQNASVGDFVWMDENSDGIQQPAERANKGIVNLTVELYQQDNANLVASVNGPTTRLVQTTVTDGNGLYKFTALAPGNYYLRFAPSSEQEKYIFVQPDQGSDDGADTDVEIATGTTPLFALQSGQYDDTRDAGLQVVTGETPVPEPMRTLLFLPLITR